MRYGGISRFDFDVHCLSGVVHGTDKFTTPDHVLLRFITARILFIVDCDGIQNGPDSDPINLSTPSLWALAQDGLNRYVVD